MPEPLTHSLFARHLNTPFTILGADGARLPFELVHVSDVKQTGAFESFSLVLRGPAAPYLPQAIYTFDHAELGAFDLFLVPIRQDAQGLYYEAVFNRPLSADLP